MIRVAFNELLDILVNVSLVLRRHAFKLALQFRTEVNFQGMDGSSGGQVLGAVHFRISTPSVFRLFVMRSVSTFTSAYVPSDSDE